MTSLLRPLILLTILLAVPIVPLLVWGEFFGNQLAAWEETPPDRWVLAAGVAGILAADIVLPVPSGPVSTVAGAQLGVLLGTMACWLGMTMGATLAFAMVRRWGQSIALRFAKQEDLDRLAGISQRNDLLMLLVTRPLPVFAESCVLLVGLLQTPWSRFFPAIAISNLAIATTYCSLGQYAADHEWLPLAVCMSLTVPVALMLWARCYWKTSSS